MDIDPSFIDVDFEKQPQFVRGYDRSDIGDSLKCRSYGDVVPEIPESQWQAECDKIDAAKAGIEYLVTRIYNQKSEGSCVANACSQANEIIQAKQFGKENVVPLSAMSLYKRIGRSPGSGANVGDGLDEMAGRGVLPLDTPENRARFGDKVMPNTGFYEKYPEGWEAIAVQFRVLEWFVIKSLAQIVTAGINGHPIVVGRSGHSICYTRPIFKSGKLLYAYPNSWGDWGSACGDMTTGFGFDSLGSIKSSAQWAFAARAVAVPAWRMGS